MPVSSVLHLVEALGTGYTVIAGSFSPNGSSAVSSASVKGAGFTVARTSAGLFTVTFRDNFPALVAYGAHLGLATGDDKFAQVGLIDVVGASAAKTMKIRVWDISGAAETDVSAATGNVISFWLVVKKVSSGN